MFKRKRWDEAVVASVPKCDYCERLAMVDGKTKDGPWANMCEKHFEQNGIGLGQGMGQKYILVKPLAETGRK